MVRFRDAVKPVAEWKQAYAAGLEAFGKRIKA
jgi:hypothetical protein